MSGASRLISEIELACSEYEREGVDLPEFQQDVEPRVSAIEIDKSSTLARALAHFVAQLEYIRFMYEAGEQRDEVMREISSLRKALEENGRDAAG